MPQSSTRAIGLAVHQASIAVAYVAKEHHAAVVYPGSIGTRQCDLDTLIRQLQSRRQRLIFVYEAGPCGYWLSLALPAQNRARLRGGRPLLDSQKGRRLGGH
jgi:transposase